MIKKTCAILTALVLLLGTAAAEGSGVVMTSFYPIYLFVLNLTDGIDGLTVRNLAAPGTGCLHDYQLQMGDMRALADADLFLINGAGMESYLPMVTSAYPDLPVRDACSGIELLHEDEIGMDVFEAEEDETNAHVWLDAKKAAQMADNLAEALKESYPDLSDRIETNRIRFAERLQQLDDELTAGLSDLPRKDIVTFHEAFPYFAQAYGLHVAAVVNREPGDALAASQLAELSDLLRELDLPPVFVEPQYDDLAARTLSTETGVQVYTLDPCVTGPEEDIPLDYYEQVMRRNMETLQEALGG